MERRSSELSPVPVRLASLADVPVLGDLEVRAGERFRTVGLDEIADDDPPPAGLLTQAVAEQRLWVAECDDQVVGYALGMDVGHQPHLEQVSVLPEYGGRNIGALLVAAVAGWARGLGDSLTLSTFRDLAWNAPWYERLGFVTLAEDELTAPLLEVRDEEVANGVDMAPRVFMRLALDPATS